MLVLYPILIAALVGFAVTSGPSKPRVAILNEVPPSANTIDLGGQRVNVSKESKPLFESIKTVKVHSRAEAIRKVRDGDVLAALVIPPDITQNLGLATGVLNAVGTPIHVDSTVVKGGKTPLGAFAAAIAVTVTLMFITLLLAAGALALEREENAFRRIVRGIVSQTGLLVEKIGLAGICSGLVALVLLAGLSLFVTLPWSRLPLWILALAAAAAAFGALGVAMGRPARAGRAAAA